MAKEGIKRLKNLNFMFNLYGHLELYEILQGSKPGMTIDEIFEAGNYTLLPPLKDRLMEGMNAGTIKQEAIQEGGKIVYKLSSEGESLLNIVKKLYEENKGGLEEMALTLLLKAK